MSIKRLPVWAALAAVGLFCLQGSAGDVTAVVKKGSLSLKGSDGDDHVVLTWPTFNGKSKIDGGRGTNTVESTTPAPDNLTLKNVTPL